MASNKKESSGIALLSIYGDEDDDMEDVEEDEEQHELQEEAGRQNDAVDATEIETASTSSSYVVVEKQQGVVEMEAMEEDMGMRNKDYNPKGINDYGGHSATSTPQQLQFLEQMQVVEERRIRKGRLAIVDYGHDEVALSPEQEDGEILDTGRVTYGEDLHFADGDVQETKTPSGTVQILTPSAQATPLQSSEPIDQAQPDDMNYALNESEPALAEEAVAASVEEPKDADPLDKFLPPPPMAKCSDELQEKIIKFLAYKKTTGRSFNSEVRNRKEYRNPDFLLHAVTYQDIDQIGSCFSKDVFDPHGYDKSDFYDEIEADMRREMERRERERKNSQKVDFISAGAQPAMVVPTAKINLPIPGVSSVPSSGLNTVSAEPVSRDGRQNKRSKWDKVDGGQDSVSAIGAHAALFSATNAGSGYSAFAQQRRREAEDRRSSDRKLERRS